MWKQICRNRQFVNVNVRHFLSDAFKCSEAWQNRLQSPILQRVKPEIFYYELDRKFQEQGKVCAIDIDIFANAVNDNTLLVELSNIMHKLRMTAETRNTLDSTSHAVIRHYIDFGDGDLNQLIHLLDDRLSYGIFLDTYTANLLLDRLINLKNWRLAAQTATFLMLQESFENPLNRALSLFACYKYLEDPQPFEQLVKEQEPIIIEDSKADGKAKKAKKRAAKEEIRVRINYLRNEFFDDHFDLRNSHHLVGKTFLMIAPYLDGAVGNSVQLLGYSFYEKFEDGCKFIKSLDKSNKLYKDAVEIAKNKLTQIKDRDNDDHFKKFTAEINKLAESTSLETSSLENALQKMTQELITKHESAEIEEQEKIYELWSEIRESKLRKELERVDRSKRVEKIDEMLNEMEEQEEKLWFFEKEDQIDLKLEKAAAHQKVETKKLTKREQKAIDDAYVPPEVERKRN